MITRYEVALADRLLRQRWFSMVTLGGFFGILPATLTAAAVTQSRPSIAAGSLLLAGIAHGGAVGWSQARILRSILIGFQPSVWTAATAAGVGIGWAVGLSPMLRPQPSANQSTTIQIPVEVAGALGAVLTVGVAQWYVLRRWTDRAPLWPWASAVAWISGAAAFAACTLLPWPQTRGSAVGLAGAALGGLAMADRQRGVVGHFASSFAVSRRSAGRPISGTP